MGVLVALAGLARVKAVAATPDELFRAGVVSLQAGKFAEAETAFRNLYAAVPGNVMGLEGVAQVYVAQGKKDDALRILDEELAKKPAWPELHVLIGDTAMRAGGYDRALTEFRRALDGMDFKNANNFYVRRGGDGSNALAVLIGPDGTPKGAAGIYLRIAEVYRAKNDPAASVAALRSADELAPHTGAILGNLGVELDASGKKKEAVEAYRAALKVNPNDPEALNNLSFLIADSGDGDLYEALRMARHAKQLAPNVPDIADTEGWVSLKLGWTDDAIGIFGDLVRKRPDSKQFREHLLLALEKNGEKTVKVTELIAALKQEPTADNQDKVKVLLEKPVK
jgi:tetratricopeptide (TPR) repeat protein